MSFASDFVHFDSFGASAVVLLLKNVKNLICSFFRGIPRFYELIIWRNSVKLWGILLWVSFPSKSYCSIFCGIPRFLELIIWRNSVKLWGVTSCPKFSSIFRGIPPKNEFFVSLHKKFNILKLTKLRQLKTPLDTEVTKKV